MLKGTIKSNSAHMVISDVVTVHPSSSKAVPSEHGTSVEEEVVFGSCFIKGSETASRVSSFVPDVCSSLLRAPSHPHDLAHSCATKIFRDLQSRLRGQTLLSTVQ